MVLVEIKGTVAAERCEEVAVLGEVTHAPDGRVVCQLGQTYVALLRMVGLHVENVHFGFKSGHYQLIHVDVRAIKLETTDAICDVRVPPEAVRPQVEQLHVSIIVAGRQAPLLLIVGVAESDSPTVRLDCLILSRFQTHNRSFLAGVPHPHAAIGSSSDELRGAKFSPLTSNTIDLVAHMRMCLHLVLLNTSLNVIYDQFSLVVNCGDISNTDRRRLKCATLHPELFLPLGQQLQLAPIQLINVEHTFSRRTLAKQAESGALRDPFDVERGESDALGGVLNDLRGFRGVHLNFFYLKFVCF